MEEYMQWRKTNGMSKEVPKFPKKITTMYISNEAKEGLERIALQHKFMKGLTPSVSKLVEAIGLFQVIVSAEDNIDTDHPSGLIDPDGLDEQTCFDQGYKDFNEKKLPQFNETALAGGRIRSRVFTEAYGRGYLAAFLDNEIPQDYTTDINVDTDTDTDTDTNIGSTFTDFLSS